ncbi:MAG: hypothetical protein H7Z13_07490 [Ferruginibacter sp.]|nr:hypothetical protein [Ferruginibacter sp.]
MKQYSRSIIFTALMVLAFCFVPDMARAIGPPDPCDSGPCDPDTPIDGGVSVLVAAGVVYGLKKIRDERKKKLNKLP